MSEEFVAAFVDQQPQDVQAVFREANHSRYLEMSRGLATVGAPGSAPVAPPKYEMPKIFDSLNDAAFLNKG